MVNVMITNDGLGFISEWNFASKRLHMLNRITDDLALGYSRCMDLIQDVASLVLSCNSDLNIFISRPAASSGILLGAVTLPAVTIARLIQLSRGFLIHEVGIEGISTTY